MKCPLATLFAVVAGKQGKNRVHVVDHASADPEPPKQ
jgi:hypothetical protein